VLPASVETPLPFTDTSIWVLIGKRPRADFRCNAGTHGRLPTSSRWRLGTERRTRDRSQPTFTVIKLGRIAAEFDAGGKGGSDPSGSRDVY